MSTQSLRLVAPRPVADPRWQQPGSRRPLGELLLEMGCLSPADLIRARGLQARQEARLGEILMSHRMVTEAELFTALKIQYSADVIDLDAALPDPRLVDALGAERCVRDGIVPWRRVGGGTVVVTSRPELFDRVRTDLPESFGNIYMGLAFETSIHRAILRSRRSDLVRKAETRVRSDESCRNWDTPALRRLTLALALVVTALLLTAPTVLLVTATLWAVFTLFLCTALKAAAGLTWWMRRSAPPPDKPTIARAPIVSILVPIFKEREIAQSLVRRLARLDYPKELLDICLVMEEDDLTTRETLRNTRLPGWMRTISVPNGSLKTKPRALNFALDFCRGSIIGVYDAEDAPAPDQIQKVVERFHARPANIACLQGVLDFYNKDTNWLARCFTIEYATWFRLVLPGLQSLGLVIPLGGTTLFFRRSALEELGGWDAHNVTEDADLGVRLARHGYKTELIHTVTEEEANCRAWPWVKQRSRWLKGYAVTYGVHMRAPRRLLRELGIWRFFGFQITFLASLSQFVLAPLLWSFWLIPFGLPHPITAVFPSPAIWGFAVLFIASELIGIALGLIAVSGPGHRRLQPWVPTLHFYFPLGSLAVYKGLLELIYKPFYWDKTAHGVFAPTGPVAPSRKATQPPAQLALRP